MFKLCVSGTSGGGWQPSADVASCHGTTGTVKWTVDSRTKYLLCTAWPADFSAAAD